MRGDAVLFSEMTPDTSFEADFHDWYDNEHIPIRMDAPGFRSAQRYKRDGGPGYLAVYELASDAALRTPSYDVIKKQPSTRTRFMLDNVTGFTRYTARSIGIAEKAEHADAFATAPVLYAVSFTVPKDGMTEFDAWNEEEHVPLLMRCGDWLQVRRFEVISGEPGTYTRLTLHYLRDKSALESPERAAARNTDWRKRLAERSWFKGDYAVFEAFRPRQVGRYPEL